MNKLSKQKVAITTILLLILSLMLIHSPATKALTVTQISTVTQNPILPQNATDSTAPKPLTDPSQAYISPNFYKSPVDSNLNASQSPRDAPHLNYSGNNLQKIQAMVSSNATLRQMVNEATSNPNILLINKTIANTLRAANTEFQESGLAVPSAHSAWGTDIGSYYTVFGGFAQQYISSNLNLGLTPNEDKTLFAPTMTLPQPCPLEISTVYGYVASSNTNDGHIGIFDFYLGSWVSIISIQFNDANYIFDSGTARPYYYAEIEYWPQQGVWDAYLWNRNINNWELMYTEPYGYTDFWETTRLWDGWDQFEAVSPNDGGYDNSWAGVNIINQIESNNLMIYWDNLYQFEWDYASSSNGCSSYSNTWGNTPFAQTHYFSYLCSDWIVRDPMITVNAYDSNYGCFVNAAIYVDGNLCW